MEYAKMLFAEKGINLYPDILTDTCSIGITEEYKKKMNTIALGKAYPKGKEKILSAVKKKRKRIQKKI